VISEEWKRRDRERELVVKKKIGEYAALETQLRAALNDLEARQKSLHDKVSFQHQADKHFRFLVTTLKPRFNESEGTKDFVLYKFIAGVLLLQGLLNMKLTTEARGI
jgi:hypothetical protein